ncbi:MAG TPA: response regulator transcription factor [Oscillatoriaceae cyanobacterium M33_DOE_052]|uniref:Response regulator transcription factor n=1 Tax=Planktothricoides sp. SpSt-374 TaxID=2282167 RepID=A0A7C3VJK8_9CYAN|nr:response regulator transcription factor [Oscillatoriaceae cyanobacterium M33_DOE_052]
MTNHPYHFTPLGVDQETLTPNPSPSVLVISADKNLAERISLDLRESGYAPLVAYNSRTGLQQVVSRQPALIVIDKMLGEDSGLHLCQELRQSGNYVPVLLLMSRDTVDDRVACLEAGADDYFLKPYRSEDFLKLIRLYLEVDSQDTHILRFGELVLDLSVRRALRSGRVISLTMKEYELLKFLMEHPREVLTREQILETVWGDDFLGESNVIEVYIRYLRLKLELDGDKRLIHTVRGVGYVLREN